MAINAKAILKRGMFLVFLIWVAIFYVSCYCNAIFGDIAGQFVVFLIMIFCLYSLIKLK